MGIRTYISFVLALLMLPVMSPAQSGTDPEGQDEVLGIVSRADSLRKEYRFQEALELYSSAAVPAARFLRRTVPPCCLLGIQPCMTVSARGR